MVDRGRWVFLVYRLPREPSTPRIAIWRKLKRLGMAQLTDGLVALPLDSRNREQLEWVAELIVEADGEASVWVAEPTTARQERTLASAMANAIAGEYRAVVEAAARARDEGQVTRRRTLARLRREMHRIGARDYFPTPERRQAEAAIAELAVLTEVSV